MLPCRPGLLAPRPTSDVLVDDDLRLEIRKLRYAAAALKAAGEDTIVIELQSDEDLIY
jgi:hypothetical protein